MSLRQAAQQALEALKSAEDQLAKPYSTQAQHAITALRQALAEPRPIQECYGDCPTNPQTCPNPCNFEGRPKPEQKGWFTIPEVNEWAAKLPQTTHWEGCEAVHPECKKPEQEPVAQYSDIVSDGGLDPRNKFDTAPAPRKPLTDEEIERACVPLGAAMLSFTEVARAIERAHGIGEQP